MAGHKYNTSVKGDKRVSKRMKKSVKLDLERCDKLYALIDKALKEAKVKVSVIELNYVFYTILRNFQTHVLMNKRQKKVME